MRASNVNNSTDNQMDELVVLFIPNIKLSRTDRSLARLHYSLSLSLPFRETEEKPSLHGGRGGRWGDGGNGGNGGR